MTAGHHVTVSLSLRPCCACGLLLQRYSILDSHITILEPKRFERRTAVAVALDSPFSRVMCCIIP